MSRIAAKFNELKTQNKKANIGYLTAGDPTYDCFLAALKKLPENGVDILEVGMPFLDPAGDGKTIEKSSKRAVEAGMKIKDIFKAITQFRKSDDKTPVILMGYYNSVFHYGHEEFCAAASKSGVDGMLVVDLPPEEDEKLRTAAKKYDLDLIKLVALTSSSERIKLISSNASGFIYLVSILGITGTKSAVINEVESHIEKIRKATDLPIAVGFGIKTRDQVLEMKNTGADGIVVGSALIKVIEDNLESINKIPDLVAQKSQELFSA